MASDGGVKPEVMSTSYKRKVYLAIPLLRLFAFFATLTAALIMALDKQTKTIVVATIGTVPLQATLRAKFQHTPAFVFFVIANGAASLHSCLMLVLHFLGPKFDFKGLAPLAIAILDLLNAVFVSGGASAAVFMGQLGRDGNTHTRWNKICDKFDEFCDRAGGAMIASFIGLTLMIIITIFSIVKLRSHNHHQLLNSNSLAP